MDAHLPKLQTDISESSEPVTKAASSEVQVMTVIGR